MKITTELLEKYNCDPEIIKFVENNFPNGASPLEIMANGELPINFLHTMRLLFIDSPEEIKRYNELCGLIDCDRAINSEQVKNGKIVIRSSYVEDSSYVFDSTHIFNSHYIYNSSNINNCEEVNLANSIDNSNLIIKSTNVRDSYSICESDYINWSKNILFGRNINDSQFIYKSNDLVDCYFSGFLRDCKHCMFCSNLEGAEYYIFNKQVGRDTFETWKESLMFMLSDEDEFSSFITVYSDEKINVYKRYKYNLRFDNVFNGLSEDFYEWIGNLPNYNEQNFLNLFFRERKI